MSTTTRRKNLRKNGKATEKARLGNGAPQPDEWEGWVRHLAARRRPKPLQRILSGKLAVTVGDPLGWGLSREVPDDGRELLAELSRIARGKPAKTPRLAARVEDWLARTPSAEDSPNHRAGAPAGETLAWETLAWCHAAPRLAELLPAATWNELLDRLLETARQSQNLPLEDGLLQNQLLAGELPLTLAVLFPELASCRRLLNGARRKLSWGLCESTDGEGLPHASSLDEIRPLLACWTRCAYLDPSVFDEAAETQFEWLVRQAIRLCRPDGSQVLAGDATGAWDKRLFTALLGLAADKDDWTAAERLLPLKRTKGRGGNLPEATVISSWSELAVMRSQWSRRAPQFAVRFDHPRMHCELSCNRALLLAGAWQSSYEVDGRSIDEDSEWVEVCCFSDDDVDYLELERKLAGGWSVQRQLLLAHADGLLLLADALLGSESSGELVCRGELPLGPGTRARFSDESREAELAAGKARVRLLPLALPEWRVEPAAGDLGISETDDALRWETRGRGSRLMHPLLIDLNSRRSDKPLTWRRLTVAAQRAIEPPDVAVGYRVRLGKHQWLIYRALSGAANRTVLGQNYAQEFVMARFKKDGTGAPLIEIETE